MRIIRAVELCSALNYRLQFLYAYGKWCTLYTLPHKNVLRSCNHVASSWGVCRREWGTSIRKLMRGMATLPQGNQELLVVKDKAGRPQVSLGQVHGM